MRPKKEMDIQELINSLEQEKQRGATKVVLEGKATLISKNRNAVILTTESQW